MGAEVQPGGGTHFRVWSPKRNTVDVVSGAGELLGRLTPENNGYFSGHIPNLPAGTLYRYRLDEGGQYPDPASRFQPDGPHGPSAVIDPGTFTWTDAAWRGLPLPGQVIYEMHIGTFTREGTWRAAIDQLGELADTGITVLEVMPIAEFPGRFGWGYDGVDLFAPTWLYGTPDDLRAFVDAAHSHNIAVILDVVYNHFGPDGNYMREFSDHYFSTTYKNEWGDPINFDDEHSAPVREFFLANAAYWIDEFHLDGLRLDATQQIFDSSPEHILTAIGKSVRKAAKERVTIIVGENEPQESKLIRPLEEGGYGLDGLWNDDFHHSAMVALTGRNEAYYTDYQGTAREFVSMVKRGFLYQGQYYSWQQNPRGTPSLGIDACRFILFLQNHDQVANSLRGLRIHQMTSPGRLRALTALTLLAPGTPMLFQGQEFAASTPFLYFADQIPELSKKVRDGRLEFLTQFPSINTEEAKACIADPGSPATFERCRLDFTERDSNRQVYAFHRDLLGIRREDEVLRSQCTIEAASLSEHAFLLRWLNTEGNDRLLLVNLGRDLSLIPMNENLLAPPTGKQWVELWNSESPVYGGLGNRPLLFGANATLQGESAILLTAKDRTDE